MSKILNLSEATALALHAMIYLEAHNDRKVSTKEIAGAFRASEAHLSKVMQRLVKAGMVKSVRGPKGGFELVTSDNGISLLHLYELFEGPISDTICLFDTPVCGLENCVIGDLLLQVNNQVVEYMTKTSLSKVAKLYKKGSEN